jgi:hypothetical protein
MGKMKPTLFAITMRKVLFLLPLLLLYACSSAPKMDGRSTAEAYLQAVKDGDLQTQQAMYCIPADALSVKNVLKGLKDWQFVSEVTQKSDTSIPYYYSLVSLKEGDSHYQIEVWQTDDVYKHDDQVMADLRSKGTPVENLLSDRSKWSQQAKCVRASL